MTHIISYIQHLCYIVEGYVLCGWDIISGHASERSKSRMKICTKCEFYKSGICIKCGCILKAKTRVDFILDENGKSIGGCPLKKW